MESLVNLKKTIFFLILFFLSFIKLNAQNECATILTSEEEEYLSAAKVLRQAFYSSNKTNADIIYIPVQNHVFHSSNGTGGLLENDITTVIATLNYYYKNSHIVFYECSPTDNINSDTYYDFDNTQESSVASLYDISNVLNIYYCNSVYSSGTSVCGYAHFPSSTPKDRIFLKNSCATNGSSIVHEVGHYFSLYHTHGSSNNGTTTELVNGSNCYTDGDELCDTPADPNIDGLVDANCQYTGNATDANGDFYSPLTDNIMSYSSKSCRDSLTPDQYSRANYSAIYDRAYLSCSSLASYYCGSLGTVWAVKYCDANSNNGAIGITVSGGKQPYQYLWSNGDTVEDISNLSGGTYILIISDAAGCIISDTITVLCYTSSIKEKEINTSFIPYCINGKLEIKYTGNYSFRTNVTIVDILGNVLFSDQVLFSPQTENVIPIEKLNSGMYCITISNQTYKVIYVN